MRERHEFQSSMPEYLLELERDGFVVVENGIVRACDPVYGEKLTPGEAPRSVREDESFQRGIGGWRWLIDHGVGGEMVGSDHGGESYFEELQKQAGYLTNCQVVGLECNSTPGRALPRTLGDISFETMGDSGFSQYISLTRQWINGYGIPTVPCDIDTPTTLDPKDDALRTRLAMLLSKAGQAARLAGQDKRNETTVEDWERYHLVWSTYQYTRQYLMGAQLGMMARLFEDRLRAGDTVALVVGSGHVPGIPQKLAQFNIPITVRPLVTPRAGTVFEEKIYREAMPTGSISQQDLRAVAEYELAKSS